MRFQEGERLSPLEELQRAMAEINRIRRMQPLVIGHPDDVAKLRDAYDWDDLVELRESRFATKGKLMVYDPAKVEPYELATP